MGQELWGGNEGGSVLDWCFSKSVGIVGKLVKIRSGSVALRESLKLCISDEFPGDINATSTQTTLKQQGTV
jgi:hypothetical protein